MGRDWSKVVAGSDLKVEAQTNRINFVTTMKDGTSRVNLP